MNKKALRIALLLSAGLFSSGAVAEYARQYIHILGSSTVLPFARAVGEKISKSGKVRLPRLESTGTGGGIKLFCEGMGGDYPDIVNASRAMKPKERNECQTNGAGDLLELKVGYDGLVLAQSAKAPALSLSGREIRAALAKWVPNASGKLVLNPNKTWHQINPALPDAPIEIFGPPQISGTFDALVDLIAEGECGGPPWVDAGKSEPGPDLLRKCRAVRDDGVYVEGSENDEEFLLRLEDAPARVALLNYPLFAKHAGKLRAAALDGVSPEPGSIASHRYPATRPLFMYVKKARIGQMPGLKEFLAEAASERAWGDKGYLTGLGLVALTADERKSQAAEVKALTGIAPATEAVARKPAVAPKLKQPAPAAAPKAKPAATAAKAKPPVAQAKEKKHTG